MLNSSNVQPDNESLLMINSSHGVDFVCFFLFPCKKDRALVIYFPFEGLLYITWLKCCIAQLNDVSSSEHSLQAQKHGAISDFNDPALSRRCSMCDLHRGQYDNRPEYPRA